MFTFSNLNWLWGLDLYDIECGTDMYHSRQLDCYPQKSPLIQSFFPHSLFLSNIWTFSSHTQLLVHYCTGPSLTPLQSNSTLLQASFLNAILPYVFQFPAPIALGRAPLAWHSRLFMTSSLLFYGAPFISTLLLALSFSCTKLLVHPWAPRTSHLCTLAHTEPSPWNASLLWFIWLSIGHHLISAWTPSSQGCFSPLLCASLWRGLTISPCCGLSTSLPHLLPPSSMSSLWADRGGVSMKLRVPQLLTCPALSQGPDGGSSNEFSWPHYYWTQGVGHSRRCGCC